MKEKLDLSLDNRQLVSLFLAGVVVLGAVFVIGVVVGKKLATAPRPAQSTDVLTALDQKAEQMEQARQDPPLTFQEELTRKTAEPAQVAHAEPKPAEKVIATSDVAPAKASAAESHPKPASANKPSAKKADVKVASAKLPVIDGQVAQGPVPTRTAGSEDLHAAFARIEQATSKPASSAAGGGAAGAYAVQVAASQNRADAEAQVSRLKAKGYSPYIVTANVPGKGVWYRVRLGSFSSREDASRYLDDFRRETRLDAFVASAH